MSTQPILPLENGSLREQANNRLRRLLILEQIPEGQRLREAEWAERLNVNRTALREAFARLEAEGFIERGPKTGYFVPTLTNKDKQTTPILHDFGVAYTCVNIPS